MANNKKNIVWIVSYPKSGNTWFRIFLSNLLSKSNQAVNINEINSTIISSSREHFDGYTGINSSDLSVGEINDLRPNVYKHISAEFDKTIYIKVHDLWQKNNLGNELFPPEITKGVIYILRNPLDLVLSFANHNKVSISEAISVISDTNSSLASNPMKLAAQLNQQIGSWSQHVKSWIDLSKLKVHVMRYEDMLSKSIQTFNSAVEFLGINASENRIKEAIENSSFVEMIKQEQMNGFREKPINSDVFFKFGKQGYYKEFLSNSEIESIISSHSETMNRFYAVEKRDL